MIAVQPKSGLSLARRVVLTTALFVGGVGGFLLGGYLIIAILTL